MSLAVNISSKLFQDGLVALEIKLPKQKVKLLIVSQFVPTHPPTHFIFCSQENQIHTPFCPLNNGKSFRFLLLLLACLLSLLNLKQNKTKTTFFAHQSLLHFPFSLFCSLAPFSCPPSEQQRF